MRNDFAPSQIVSLFWLEKETKVLWQVLLAVINSLITQTDESGRKYLFEALFSVCHEFG